MINIIPIEKKINGYMQHQHTNETHGIGSKNEGIVTYIYRLIDSIIEKARVVVMTDVICGPFFFFFE